MSDKKEKHRVTGKWLLPGVPKKGWINEDTADLNPDDDPDWDLEDDGQVCEMCEEQHYRYGQLMSHTEYPDKLWCGRVCAGRMEDEYASTERERAMRNATAKRRRDRKRAAEEAAREWHAVVAAVEDMRCDPALPMPQNLREFFHEQFTDWERGFLQDTATRRKLTLAQVEKHRQINTRLLRIWDSAQRRLATECTNTPET